MLNRFSLRLVILLVGFLAGCAAQLPADNRSPEQIAASAKDKSATVECYYITSVYGVVRTVRVSVDKSSLGSGGASVTTDPETCKATITMTPRAPSAPATAGSAP